MDQRWRSRKALYDYKITAFYRRMKSVPLLAFKAVVLTLIWARGASLGESSFRRCSGFSLPGSPSASACGPAGKTAANFPRQDRRLFRLVARKTWRFFETFVTAEHHHLPPDNFQEIPRPGHRAPHVADEHRPLSFIRHGGAPIRLAGRGRDGRAIGSDTRHDPGASTCTKATYSIGTTPKIFAPWSRFIFRPSTAETWPAIYGRSEMPAARKRMALFRHVGIMIGVEDVLDLLSAGSSAGTMAIKSLRQSLADDLSVAGMKKRSSCVDIARTLDMTYAGPKGRQKRNADLVGTLAASAAKAIGEILIWVKFCRRPSSGAWPLLARTCHQMVQDMQFGFLCDPIKKIFSDRVSAGRTETGSQLLRSSGLGSASRELCGDRQGRCSRAALVSSLAFLSPVELDSALLSWSGSMFEYLMPSLVMHPPAGSLLDQTCRSIVRRQIAYGKENGRALGHI